MMENHAPLIHSTGRIVCISRRIVMTDACTIDSCDPLKGCVHIQKNCADRNACTIDRCDGKGHCIHIMRSCYDGNPCTVDACDSYWGCIHTPVVCGAGTTCINGACLPVSSPSAIVPSSYSIPAGSSIALPWGSVVTALDSVQVENGIAYTTRSPLIFVRKFGDNLAIPRDQSLGRGIRKNGDGGPHLAR